MPDEQTLQTTGVDTDTPTSDTTGADTTGVDVPTEDPGDPPPDWRGGYEILAGLELIQYSGEEPQLTPAGILAAQSFGLEPGEDDIAAATAWAEQQTLDGKSEPSHEPREDERAINEGPDNNRPETAHGPANDQETHLAQEEIAPSNPTPDEAISTEEQRISAASAVHLKTDLPSAHWQIEQTARPHESAESGLRSLTRDRPRGGLPRRSYPGMPRPIREEPIDLEVRAGQINRKLSREEEISRAVTKALAGRHHRTARITTINGLLCGTLINGEEVFDSDVTTAINTLIANGKIVVFSNGDIFLLNPPGL